MAIKPEVNLFTAVLSTISHSVASFATDMSGSYCCWSPGVKELVRRASEFAEHGPYGSQFSTKMTK